MGRWPERCRRQGSWNQTTSGGPPCAVPSAKGPELRRQRCGQRSGEAVRSAAQGVAGRATSSPRREGRCRPASSRPPRGRRSAAGRGGRTLLRQGLLCLPARSTASPRKGRATRLRVSTGATFAPAARRPVAGVVVPYRPRRGGPSGPGVKEFPEIFPLAGVPEDNLYVATRTGRVRPLRAVPTDRQDAPKGASRRHGGARCACQTGAGRRSRSRQKPRESR